MFELKRNIRLRFLNYLILFAWSIVLFHDILPHYHPEHTNTSIELIDQNTKSEKQDDEGGILDNLVLINNIHSFNLKQIFTTVFEFQADISSINNNIIASCSKISLRLPNKDEPPDKQDYCNLFLLRAPPLSV